MFIQVVNKSTNLPMLLPVSMIGPIAAQSDGSAVITMVSQAGAIQTIHTTEGITLLQEAIANAGG